MVGWNVTVTQEEEREPLQPDSNNRDVKVINDLIEDLTKLELVGERVPLARLYNNNKERRPVTVRTGGQGHDVMVEMAWMTGMMSVTENMGMIGIRGLMGLM